MKQFACDKIRNIALLGHGSCGKTTLAEAILAHYGVVERMGKVADGNTVMDFDPEEKRRGISISSAVCAVDAGEYKLNIIDAPGLFDFEAGVHEAVRAADSALIVLSGKSGLNVGSEAAYDDVTAAGKPVAFFIGKLNSAHANYYKVLSRLTGKYGAKVCPVIAPSYDADKLVGYADLITGNNYTWDGATLSRTDSLGDERLVHMIDLLNEAVASQDEALMEKYFEGTPFTAEEKLGALRTGMLSGDICPVFAGAGATGEAVGLTLEHLAAILPAPTDMTEEAELGGEVVKLECDQSAPTAAIVFKTVADPFVGKMSIFKVVSGCVSSSEKLVCARTGAEVKINKAVTLRGGRQEDTDRVVAGDIGAVTKLNDIITGDTICAAARPVTLAGVNYPRPNLSMAVYAVKKGDEEKIAQGLVRLIEEDPTISLTLERDTGEQVLSGLGEQHLDVIASKLKNKFGAEMELRQPQIPYRETIRRKSKVQGKHKKQSGGHGQFGDVWIEFEPCEGNEIIFEEKVFGGAVPKNFFPAVEKGLRDSAQHGVIAGYPMIGVKATLVDGSYHPVDSSEMAFKTAASLAYKAGIAEAAPVLLEPIGTLTVRVPDDSVGDVIGDINKRRGRVLGMEPIGGARSAVSAEVPMAEMSDFATAMRSITRGKADFTVSFERYEELPEHLAAKVKPIE